MIAEGYLKEAGAEVDQRATQSEDGPGVVEADVEGAADGAAGEGVGDVSRSGRRGHGVGMQEEKGVCAAGDGVLSAPVELWPPSRRRAHHIDACPVRHAHGVVPAAAIGDDDGHREGENTGQDPRQGVLFVEGGNDDGEIQSGGMVASPLDSMSEREFTHLDADGGVHMVDVSGKDVTRRVAEASCRVVMRSETVRRLGSLPKGDALVVARLAGIQAAKRTAELVPLAHPLPIDQVDVVVAPQEGGVIIRATVVVNGRTGAEMEALTACGVAALALYDMVKAVERGAVITDLRLERKSGGRSGSYTRES